MGDRDLALAAHLMRRAGFGASRGELETLATRPYDDVVDDLLHPERFPDIDTDLCDRYYGWDNYHGPAVAWMYRMAVSRRPLQEKMALFWHHVFATAFFKSEHVATLNRQVEMFRRSGMSDLRTILIELSRDPAMIYWLDNNENVSGEPNENYGRELLERFSMGVGSYTELDIKNASRAFTGWTFAQPIPLYPHGHYDSHFELRPEEHDDGVKTFLGETGRFDGGEIVDIIVRQPATAVFIGRHLYNFFVADEPQVPAWPIEPPRDPEAVRILVSAYLESNGDMRAVLRALFTSDFFKEAQFQRVKSPTELVTGVMNLVGFQPLPEPGIGVYQSAVTAMGQELLNPPTVEGWHTGKEWIDGGTLNERVNFAVNEVGDGAKPGIREIVDRVSDGRGELSPEEFMAVCLDLVGPLTVGEETREALMAYADSEGPLRFDTEEDEKASGRRIVRMVQLIVSSMEYQFG